MGSCSPSSRGRETATALPSARLGPGCETGSLPRYRVKLSPNAWPPSFPRATPSGFPAAGGSRMARAQLPEPMVMLSPFL